MAAIMRQGRWMTTRMVGRYVAHLEAGEAVRYLESYCQIWCTGGCSCGGSAVLDDLDAVVEPDSLDDLREVAEAT